MRRKAQGFMGVGFMGVALVGGFGGRRMGVQCERAMEGAARALGLAH